LARAAGLLIYSGFGFHLGNLSREPVGGFTLVFAGGRFRKNILARHTSLRDAGFYQKTGFPRSTLARRSTSKRKKQKKRGSKYPTGPRSGKQRKEG
jgi:hypothetical protein